MTRNVKPESIKLLEENIGNMFFGVVLSYIYIYLFFFLAIYIYIWICVFRQGKQKQK